MSLVDFDHLHLPRHAFSPRDTARAGDLWRLFQDAAVLGSARLGWDPDRYRREGCAFVVRQMTAVHHREIRFGEPLAVRTWVSSFRGGRFSNRQVRVAIGGEVVSAATQEWVHVSSPDLKITRASADLLSAFALHELEPDLELPEVTAEEGAEREFAFEAWHGWMDPLAHANHPLYVDWADEALARWVASEGGDPQGLVPLAERVSWRTGVTAGDRVVVRSRRVGRAAGGAEVHHHAFLVGDRTCAEATTIRGRANG